MKNTLTVGAALLATTSMAVAGGLDRGGNNYGLLFEDGNYAELSFGKVTPEVSGDYAAPLSAFGASTGDMANDYTSFGAAFKFAINDQLDVGVYFNSPYGADAEYSSGAYTGLKAQWSSTQTAVVLRYGVAEGVSVYGGIRAIQSEASIEIPSASPAGLYTAEAASDTQIGYVVGAAYERPDIALRVGLTYESGVTHQFDTTEAFNGTPITAGTVTDIEIPQAITLDFQTGIAADTLLFGSIRYSEWSVWEVRPTGYEGLTGDRVTGIDNDATTYRIGVGRRISDELSVFGRVTYEPENGGVASRLTPTDGSTAIGVGGTYTMDNVKLTGGIEYVMIGDATDGSGTEFTENSAIGMGLTVGFNF